MKNQQVAEIFVRSERETKTKNLFIDKNVLYSYGHHFPLCVKLLGGFIINSDSYSVSTARHKGYIVRKLNGNFILMNIKQIREVIENNIKTIEEAKNFFILKAL